jgi:hypothetical protein
MAVLPRIRIVPELAGCGGAVFGGLLMAGDAFDNVSSAELGSQVRDAVRDLLEDPGA